MIGTTAALIMAGLSAAGSLGSSAMSASAAKSAAQTQSNSADQALALQRQQWEQEQANMAPWLSTGKDALATLAGAMPSLTKPFDPAASGVAGQFNPGDYGLPSQFSYTAKDFQTDPGYEFALQQAQQAIQRSAAAKGGALSGGTLKALTDYTTGDAAQQFGQSYQRAQGTYALNFNNALDGYQKNYTNAFNTYETNQGNTYNRLAALAGVGQTAANTLGNAGSNYANTGGSILMNQGNALASGTVGAANAWNSGIGSASNGLLNMFLMSQLGKQQPANTTGYAH